MIGKAMQDQPRKHHFVPQFYVAGFTKSGTKDGDLFVLDQDQRKSWRSTPKQTAHKRDFHRIEPPSEGDVMVVEKALSDLEGKWSTVLSSVLSNRRLPEDDALFADLMMFVAFSAVRVPRIRKIASEFINESSKAEIQLALSTKEMQLEFRNRLTELGHTLSDEQFEELVRFGQSGHYDIDFEQSWHVGQLIRMATTLAGVLTSRNWRLLIADDAAPDLVCSDNPVAPTWIAPMPLYMSPAFGTPNTLVSVPLSRRMALIGTTNQEYPGDDTLDRDGVARINSMTGMYANQIFASENDFVWATFDHRVGDKSDLLAALGEQDDEHT